MSLDTLPTEIISQIYLSLPTVHAATSLSATSRRLYHAFHTSKRLLILQRAAETEYGPVEEVVQLLTQNESQSAHVRRSAALSEALLKDMVKIGRVAQAWEDIYPLRKWKTDFIDRRHLTEAERFDLRQAIYRLWLFGRAFHHSGHVRTARLLPQLMHDRAMLLHNYSNAELAAMLDVHLVLRDVIANQICPSNGKVRARLHKRFEHLAPSQINIHLNYPSSARPFFGTASKYHAGISSSLYPDPELDGWGDDVGHYYVVEDMMKLDPEQILRLREQRMSKHEVEQHIASLGDCFVNNGEVFSETLGFVMRQRGLDLEELKEIVQDRMAGVVLDSSCNICIM